MTTMEILPERAAAARAIMLEIFMGEVRMTNVFQKRPLMIRSRLYILLKRRDV